MTKIGAPVPQELAETLQALEEQLLTDATRSKPELAGEFLAAEFREFGSSGRIYSRASMLDLLSRERFRPPIGVEDFQALELSPQTVLVTYRSVKVAEAGAPIRCLRSSVWMHRDGAWQMLFHQGTREPAASMGNGTPPGIQ